MIRRALAIVAVLLVLLAVLALHALPAASEVPAVSGVVQAREFIVIQPVAGTPRPVEKPAPSPSLRAVPRPAAVRLRAAVSPTVSKAGVPESTTGTASTYGPGFDGYLALPSGPGHKVRICGAGGCVVAVSNDAGPSLAMQRQGRIVDLDVATFERVCGVPWTRGLCHVSVETVQ